MLKSETKEDITKKSDQIRHGFVKDPTKGPRVEILISALHLQDREREGGCFSPWLLRDTFTRRQTRPGWPSVLRGQLTLSPPCFCHTMWSVCPSRLQVPLNSLKPAQPQPGHQQCQIPDHQPLLGLTADVQHSCLALGFTPSHAQPSFQKILQEAFFSLFLSSCRTILLTSPLMTSFLS